MSDNSTKHPRVGVGVFVFRGGKFLMGRRKGSHEAGTWSIPGGYVEFGESPEEAAVREVKEETGCDIKNVRFAAITNDYFDGGEKHHISIWLTSDWSGNEPVICESDKCVEQIWTDFDNLPDNLFGSWSQLKKSEFIDNIRQKLTKAEGVKNEQ